MNKESVPEQGQAIIELLTHLEDVLDSENFDKIDTKKWNTVSALAASRSEAQPPQDVFYCGKCRQSLDKGRCCAWRRASTNQGIGGGRTSSRKRGAFTGETMKRG